MGLEHDPSRIHLGAVLPNIDKRIHIAIAGVIVVIVLPAADPAWKARSQGASTLVADTR